MPAAPAANPAPLPAPLAVVPLPLVPLLVVPPDVSPIPPLLELVPALLDPPGPLDVPAEASACGGELEALHAKKAPAAPRNQIDAESSLVERAPCDARGQDAMRIRDWESSFIAAQHTGFEKPVCQARISGIALLVWSRSRPMELVPRATLCLARTPYIGS
jgi:hypothetical protein